LSRNFLGLSFVRLGKLSDEELMALVGAEDNQRAYEVLYKRHRRAVMSYIGNMIYDKTVVEEVSQEAFFKVYRHRSQYQIDKKFRPWLWTIARNTTLDYLRKKRDLLLEDISSGEDERDSISLIEDDSSNVEELILRKADAQRVHEILKKLPDAQREVLTLASLSEMSYEEISEITGKSISSIKSVLFRARKKFIEEMSKEEE